MNSPNPLNRERIAWLMASVFLALFAFQLNGTLGQRDDDSASMRTVLEVNRQIARNYVKQVDPGKLSQAAIEGMMTQLDKYSQYVPPAQQEAFDRHLDGTLKGIGVVLTQNEAGEIKVSSPIEDSPALAAGVLAGDVLLRINGTDLKGMKIDEVQRTIVTGPLEVQVRVRHDTGVEQDLTMTRKVITIPMVKGYRRKQDGTANWDWYANTREKIAYIRITQFTPDTYERVRSAINNLLADGMKGLILDLRFNPGGQLDPARRIVDLFVEEGKIVTVRGLHRRESIDKASADDGILPKFPLVVLVNEASASASEVVAGALQDLGRATIVGERSYGKGSVQEPIALDGMQGELKLTIAYYYLPNGRLVHKEPGAVEWGIEPQVKVEMSADQEQALQEAMQDAEVIGKRGSRPAASRPATRPTTLPATNPSQVPTTRPANQSLDPQLGAGVRVILEQLGRPIPPPTPTMAEY